jgi:hypothetical protein
MSKIQTYWRYHEKPSYRRPRHVISHSPTPGTVAYIRHLMKQAIETAIASGLPRPLFPFEAGEVEAIYTRKKDEGDGLWFGLVDGRIFRSDGAQDSSDHDLYETTAGAPTP